MVQAAAGPGARSSEDDRLHGASGVLGAALQREEKKKHAATGASVGTMRAITGQLIAFYFRAPVKAFFRTRVDYMALARAINPRVQANEAWSWRLSTPGLLAHAVRHYGWNFIPNNVAPPLIANITVSTVLYATYLQSLGALHEPSSHSSRRVYPPPPASSALAAGCFAGGLQSLVAAPLDALQVRFNSSDVIDGQYKHVWSYARHKLREIGARGIFAGWSLSFVKDAVGYGLFFAAFETIKSQGFYAFALAYYGQSPRLAPLLPRPNPDQARTSSSGRPGPEEPGTAVKPHYAIEPAFILLAGVGASLLQQAVSHPISTIQAEHYKRLEALDAAAATSSKTGNAQTQGRPISAKPAPVAASAAPRMLTLYYHAYAKTFAECAAQVREHGRGWTRWLYRGFVGATLRQVPSTSAGLIVFELIRRKYGTDSGMYLAPSRGDSSGRGGGDNISELATGAGYNVEGDDAGMYRISGNGVTLLLP